MFEKSHYIESKGYTVLVIRSTLRLATSSTVTAVFFLLLVFSFLNAHAAFGEESPCLGCHSEFKKPAKTVHPAMGMGCESCHQAAGGMKHPEQKGSMKLTQDIPGLCFGCHDQSKFQGKVVHSPVAGGMCTSCHNPHQSEYAKLLISDQPDVCYNCHDKAAFTKKIVHPAVMMGCTSCHSPHATDNPRLLPKAINVLCVTCHSAMASGKHVTTLVGGRGFHPVGGRPDPSNPGKQMSCVSCHNPHSSDVEKLFPTAAICQKCHTQF